MKKYVLFICFILSLTSCSSNEDFSESKINEVKTYLKDGFHYNVDEKTPETLCKDYYKLKIENKEIDKKSNVGYSEGENMCVIELDMTIIEALSLENKFLFYNSLAEQFYKSIEYEKYKDVLKNNNIKE